MTDSEKVDAFIAKQTKWKEMLLQLREIIQKTELTEEVKWGKPTYTYNGRMVAAMGDFKNHLALWFHQGVFLVDEENKLINAQEGVTKALRQWRFLPGQTLDVALVSKYIEEAIANAKAGKELKKTTKEQHPLPSILNMEFEKDKILKEKFEVLTPGRQREYLQYLYEAKQGRTKQERLEKCIPLILEGKGLNDKHRTS